LLWQSAAQPQASPFAFLPVPSQVTTEILSTGASGSGPASRPPFCGAAGLQLTITRPTKSTNPDRLPLKREII
jgi:hypothetical protein